MKAPIFILAALFLSNIFFCAASVSVINSLDSSGRVTKTMTVYFPDSAAQLFSFNISGNIDRISATGADGNAITPNVRVDGGNTIVTFMVQGHAKISTFSESPTAKRGRVWTYNSTTYFNTPVENYTSRIELPLGAVIRSTNGLEDDSGPAPVLSWHFDNLDRQTSVNHYVSYEILEQPDNNSFYWLVAIALIAIAFLTLIFFRKKTNGAAKQKQENIKQKQETPRQSHENSRQKPEKPKAASVSLQESLVFKMLEETDKELVLAIHSQGGKTTQAHLYASTHTAKATLSRHMASLENRGLIKRTQKGIKKIVSLEPAAFGLK